MHSMNEGYLSQAYRICAYQFHCNDPVARYMPPSLFAKELPVKLEGEVRAQVLNASTPILGHLVQSRVFRAVLTTCAEGKHRIVLFFWFGFRYEAFIFLTVQSLWRTNTTTTLHSLVYEWRYTTTTTFLHYIHWYNSEDILKPLLPTLHSLA